MSKNLTDLEGNQESGPATRRQVQDRGLGLTPGLPYSPKPRKRQLPSNESNLIGYKRLDSHGNPITKRRSLSAHETSKTNTKSSNPSDKEALNPSDTEASKAGTKSSVPSDKAASNPSDKEASKSSDKEASKTGTESSDPSDKSQITSEDRQEVELPANLEAPADDVFEPRTSTPRSSYDSSPASSFYGFSDPGSCRPRALSWDNDAAATELFHDLEDDLDLTVVTH